jgi:hypothetical protein
VRSSPFLERDRDHLAGLERDCLLTPFPRTQAELAEDIAGRMQAQCQLLPSRRNDGGLDQAVPHEVDAACGIAHPGDELARRHAGAGGRARSSQNFPRHWWERATRCEWSPGWNAFRASSSLVPGGIMRFLTVYIRPPPQRDGALAAALAPAVRFRPGARA